MKPPLSLPVWAPRIKPYLIRRLYENDAGGIDDLELLDEVGWKLYSRCASFIAAMEASQGRVICPGCGREILHHLDSKETLHCPVCGWECPLRDYLRTIRNQQLSGGPEVVALFQDYVDRFPAAASYPEKMLLVDQLIHGFHHYLRSGRTRRPVAVNLLDGDCQYVTEFLDRLSLGAGSTPGLEESQNEWREKIKSSKG